MAQVLGEQAVQTVEALQASVTLNANITTAQPIFAVPAGRTFVPTKIVLRGASTSLTTASLSFGQNGTTFTDCLATATYTQLTGPTKQVVINLGTAAGQVSAVGATNFGAIFSIAQGSAATVQCDVFGYML